MSLLRQKYHILHIREVVKRVIRKCLTCQRFRTKPLQQKMGDLPQQRVTPAPAFSDVGLDFTGPLYVRDGDKSRKCYVCVFACPRSRMVHFELTNGMSTEEFLQALRRFLNRRGWCRTIESDNQRTFKKAEKLLKATFMSKALQNLDAKQIENFVAEQGITWKFITERSPFRGAYWERMNRSLKEPLRKVLGKALLSYSELYTILTDIEAVLNQKPLSYHEVDPSDPEPITPSQLAIGRNLRELPPIQCDGNVSVTKRYKHLQQVLEHFWKRWSSEYLPTLQQRGKWQKIGPLLKIGDVVLIADDKIARPSWPLGRVIELIVSRDGLVRTVKLKTSKGVLVRPVQKLHCLVKDDYDVVV